MSRIYLKVCKKIILLSCMMMVLRAAPLNAHPHLFIEASTTIRFAENGIVGIGQTWVFDEMFSASIIEDQDKDKDGQFNKQESLTIKQEAFGNLKDFDYFTYIRVDGESFQAEKVSEFVPSIQSGKLVYKFLILFPVALNAEEKTLKISVYDKSYFTSVSMMGETPDYQGDRVLYSIASDMQRNKKFVYFEKDGFPETLVLKIRRKP